MGMGCIGIGKGLAGEGGMAGWLEGHEQADSGQSEVRPLPPPSHPSRLNIPRSDAIPIKRSGADIIGGKRRRKLC